MKARTRILIVDDHKLFREGLVRLLETESDLEVVAHCAEIGEAKNLLVRCQVDVILLDYDLGEERGSELLQELRTPGNAKPVLMVTAGLSERVVQDLLATGVAGIFYKHNSPAQLVHAIRTIAGGEMWLEQRIIRTLAFRAAGKTAETRDVRPLTERQCEVLSGILDGLANKEIAWRLKVSETSVKAVIQELFHKAGVRTRSQLVRIAVEKHSGDWLSNARELK
jgi:two-component system, NarL family, nitrate/nitrite response regulator NarL